MTLTSRYRFAAAHRLDSPALTPQQNRDLYGKCNNPFGHGHDYVLDLTVAGPVDENGLLVNREELDALVRRTVLSRLDHRNLNVDIPEFSSDVPTTENLAVVIHNYLEREWTLEPRLVRLRISETDRNSFVWEAK
ncbi:MAG: 6-carboxytetrahydropterin synthase [Acidobacteriota bacterium]